MEFSQLLEDKDFNEHRVAVERSVFDIWLMALGGREAETPSLPKIR